MAVLCSGLVGFFALLVFNILEVARDLVYDPMLVVCKKFGVVCFDLGVTLLLA